MEGFVNLFENEDKSGKKPHFKGYIKIDGIEHEFALWPAKEGKKGYTGKYKPKTAKPMEAAAPQAPVEDEIPY